MKYVYVAGPIGAVEGREQRVRDAIEVGEKLRRNGVYPFIPHLLVQWGNIHEHTYDCWMKLDFAWIKRCDGLFRMSGDSPGACKEVLFAHSLNMPVFYDIYKCIAWSKHRVRNEQ